MNLAEIHNFTPHILVSGQNVSCSIQTPETGNRMYTLPVSAEFSGTLAATGMIGDFSDIKRSFRSALGIADHHHFVVQEGTILRTNTNPLSISHVSGRDPIISILLRICEDAYRALTPGITLEKLIARGKKTVGTIIRNGTKTLNHWVDILEPSDATTTALRQNMRAFRERDMPNIYEILDENEIDENWISRHAFELGHRLRDYDGDCHNIHGHEWELTITSNQKISDEVRSGIERYVGAIWHQKFAFIKGDSEAVQIVGGENHVTFLDHPPTTQIISAKILKDIQQLFPQVEIISLTLRETPSNAVVWRRKKAA